jgi:ribonuclease HII
MVTVAHKRWPMYGFDRHKGYGTAMHREAIKHHGPCEIHRQTFLTKL